MTPALGWSGDVAIKFCRVPTLVSSGMCTVVCARRGCQGGATWVCERERSDCRAQGPHWENAARCLHPGVRAFEHKVCCSHEGKCQLRWASPDSVVSHGKVGACRARDVMFIHTGVLLAARTIPGHSNPAETQRCPPSSCLLCCS